MTIGEWIGFIGFPIFAGILLWSLWQGYKSQPTDKQ
jgi:hypothetical protein